MCLDSQVLPDMEAAIAFDHKHDHWSKVRRVTALVNIVSLLGVLTTDRRVTRRTSHP